MDKLASVIKETEDLPEFLSSPLVDEKKRREVLATVCREAGFDQDTENFLNLVMDKDRASLLEDICESFETEYCKMTETQVRMPMPMVTMHNISGGNCDISNAIGRGRTV